MMEYVNIFGLAFVAVMMAPNIIAAIKKKEMFETAYHNKAVETLEQIGRFGCIILMIINIPFLRFGWWSDEAFAVYLIVDAVLVLAYCVCWAVFWNKHSVAKALVLSIFPAVIFLFSAFMSRNVPLLIAALLFAPTHIFISYKNAKE